MRKIVDVVLPTTMVGSYPRPHWYTYQLLGRDVRVFVHRQEDQLGRRHALPQPPAGIEAVRQRH